MKNSISNNNQWSWRQGGALLLFCLICHLSIASESLNLPHLVDSKPRNIVFILVDDQRFDAMSCAGHPFLKTPALDSIAENGVLFRNAYVTTSLCSPSRASILTGLYAHTHGVVDNRTLVSNELVFFGQYLQANQYETAFIGKWHMGNASDEPRRGWDHWVSFRGQGHYYPKLKNGKTSLLNVNGKSIPQTRYITDELTDYAVDWLKERDDQGKSWMLYLSHKAVHSDFIPADRHDGRFKNVPLPEVRSTQNTPDDDRKPMWARNQRNSWHGAEFPLHLQQGEMDFLERRYYEAMLAVDESTERVLKTLKDLGLYESTLVIYMGDNGFMWGEQGLWDKRTAYDPSIRVPLLMQCPDLLPAGRFVDGMAANIDIAPTVLDAAGLQSPEHFQGKSLLSIAKGRPDPEWRTELLYEYFWERWAPSTPTLHALITPRFKYVRAYGLWDLHELYDLQNDPEELDNLYLESSWHQLAIDMDKRLFELLHETGGDSIPLHRGWHGRAKELRHPDRSPWALFPKSLKVKP